MSLSLWHSHVTVTVWCCGIRCGIRCDIIVTQWHCSIIVASGITVRPPHSLGKTVTATGSVVVRPGWCAALFGHDATGNLAISLSCQHLSPYMLCHQVESTKFIVHILSSKPTLVQDVLTVTEVGDDRLPW
jgi:hypothetical protein